MSIANCPEQQSTSHILPHHLEHLSDSGITAKTAIKNGIYSETNAPKIAIALGWKNASRLGPCLMFPVRRLNGTIAYERLRPDRPRKSAKDGKPIKYESPRGVSQAPYFPFGIDHALKDASAELVITEGEKKAICCTANGFPCIGLTGVHGWKVKDCHQLVDGLREIEWKGRQVRICFDSDLADNEQVLRAESQLAEALANHGAVVKVARLPAAANGGKQGADDFIVANGAQAFREILDAAIDPEPIDGGSTTSSLASENPEDVASEYIAIHKKNGVLTLRHWQGCFYKFHQGRYKELPLADVKNDLVQHLQWRYHKIKSGNVTDVITNVAAKCAVLSLQAPPVWLEGGDERAKLWATEDTLVTRSQLINLGLLAKKHPSAIIPNTPAYFQFNATDCELLPFAPKPERWLSFLNELWPDDPDSIALLQQWMGYLLTCDTRQQKILLVVGPRRSGKGTIARVIRSIIGERNCCAPTLASLSSNFGLSPLLDRSVAIIGDARLSGRTDVASTTERLLSISGEDAQTVDRKYREPITVKLTTRFTIISNELPTLGDASGALAGRMLILRMTRSFFEQEDPTLFRQLELERSSILLWCIRGWIDLRQQGRFKQPDSGLDLVEQISELSSPISTFVRDRCELGTSDSGKAYFATLDNLYAEYRDWSEASGIRFIPTAARFSRDLTAAFPELRRHRMTDKQIKAYLSGSDAQLSNDVSDRKLTCFKGIGLTGI